ncbi:hypothetical protein HU200_033488 [Digitaria exilis]|uniref:DUF4220 domain-containing protein n=1 Tax=Digitaria exilis TaxID=1010633 RepID=A0A835ENG4_9POAL|nr:hypothetical protein HU200_033488 [Digitaria exilis]
MGNMVRHLGNTTSTTFFNHLRDLWKSPRGIVIRIQTLAIAAIVMTFFFVAFGLCRRWCSRWLVQKGFFVAQALSLSIGTYSIGLMQSSSVRSEMYPIWTMSLFTLFGCIDPVNTYSGFDYKGPLSKMVYAICLYCGYALLMSISGVSSVVGNTAICILSAITFIKGFHRTLALVQQSRMRNNVASLDDKYVEQLGVLKKHYSISDTASKGGRGSGSHWIPGLAGPPGSDLIVEAATGGAAVDAVTSMLDIKLGETRRCVCIRQERDSQHTRTSENQPDLLKRLGLNRVKFISSWWASGYMGLRWFMATRTNWFDKHLLWQEKIGQYSMLPVGEKEAEDWVLLEVTRSNYRSNRACGKMLGLDYIWEVLWDLLGSDAEKRCDIRLEEDVKVSVTDFLGEIKDGILEGSWSSYPGHSAIEAFLLPYSCAAPQLESEPLGSRYTRCVLAWCVATWHCELAELERKKKEGNVGNGGDGVGTDGSNLGNMAAIAGAKGEAGGGARGEAPIGAGKGEGGGGEVAVGAGGEAGAEGEPRVGVGEGEVEGVAAAGGGAQGGKEATRGVGEDVAAAAEGEAAPGAGAQEAAAAGETDEERYRPVAIALAKYCAYLVVCVPELLPGLVRDTRSALLAQARDKNGLLKHVSDPAYWEGMYTALAGSNEEAMQLRSIFSGIRRGASAHSRLAAVTSSQDRWKTLTAVWVRMLVYAAPYGNAEAHRQQLSQGGEFITHLWALLYHLCIRDWKPSGLKKSLLVAPRDVTNTDDVQKIIDDFSHDSEAAVVAFVHSKSVILLAVANESSKYLDFKEAAKCFKGKVRNITIANSNWTTCYVVTQLVFVFVDKENEEHKQVANNFFNIRCTERTSEVLAYTREDNMVFGLHGEVSLDSIKDCVRILQDVKTVVGDTFDKIVLDDESKHVVLVVRSWQIYI